MTAPTLPETSTDYAHPYRPRPVRLLNLAGRGLSRVGLKVPSLSAERLISSARRRTGLDDFGPPHFREGLEVLLASAESEARLSLLGRLILQRRTLTLLSNRLRVEAFCARYPEVLGASVRAPLIITGLQRTGTTLLHRLLAAAPGARTMASYEGLSPLPPEDARPGSDPRVRPARHAERGLKYLAPDFFAIHPVEAEAPEEEVVLLDHAFRSTTPEATLHVPTYARWQEEADQEPAYRYLKKLLKVMGRAGSDEFWVLKTPHHLEWLDTLLTVFPDATVVQTHRDPQVTIGSFCSMIAHARGVFSDEVDAHEVGRHWSRKCARMVNRALESRRRLPPERFLDVSYYDLLADPVGTVEEILAFSGRPVGGDTRARVSRALQENKKDRHGRHVYRLSDFAVDEAGFEASIAAYREAYAIRREGGRGA